MAWLLLGTVGVESCPRGPPLFGACCIGFSMFAGMVEPPVTGELALSLLLVGAGEGKPGLGLLGLGLFMLPSMEGAPFVDVERLEVEGDS